MILQFVGSVLWKVLKAVAWLMLATIRYGLELVKLVLSQMIELSSEDSCYT